MEQYEGGSEGENPDWVMKIASSFPISAELKEGSGLPWGCVLRPFANGTRASLPVVDSAVVERCTSCFGYPNHLCAFEGDLRQPWAHRQW